MARAVIYARYSSDLQSDASIEDQVEVCRRYARARGWEVVRVYSDRAQSGGSAFRDGYRQLLADLDGRSFEIVLCEALDRLGRKLADVASFFDRATFARVSLHAATTGEITPLHVGMLGTMGQLYLSDLREKTWRGLLGRARAGRIPGGLAYGYRIVADGGERGRREIDPAEAGVVRRIFELFAGGTGPRAIAARLNRENVPGPGGRPWGDTTIRGQPDRGTGLLNNELYIGRLVWNRVAYVKDPRTGRRVARPNATDRHEVTELPELRIVDDELWQRVKARQQTLRFSIARDATGNALNRARRRRYLLSGLLRCGCCGDPLAIVGKEQLGCSRHRSKGTCTNAQRIGRTAIEARVLAALKTRMLTPELVEAFVRGFQEELNRGRAEAGAAREARSRELAEVTGKLAGIVRAIEGGAWSETLRDRLADLERRKAELARQVEELPAPEPIRLHPNLPVLYRQKIETLEAALAPEDTRTEAADILGSLIEKVVVTPDPEAPDGFRAELHGDLAQLLGWANGAPLVPALSVPQTPKRPPPFGNGRELSVVAGTGFEPVTFRL
ncbi:recombinase family protein [Stella sp.]|uniref:recombinase family protein n=1 Tax=Stella sp. TaxID=2912054 RepID=UPI0035AEC050